MESLTDSGIWISLAGHSAVGITLTKTWDPDLPVIMAHPESVIPQPRTRSGFIRTAKFRGADMIDAEKRCELSPPALIFSVCSVFPQFFAF